MVLRAVFTDLDGTLFTPQHRLSDYTAKVLRRLKQSGVLLIVATGRPYPHVLPMLKQIALEADYIITSNGSRVHSCDEEVLVAHDISPAVVRRLLQLEALSNPTETAASASSPQPALSPLIPSSSSSSSPHPSVQGSGPSQSNSVSPSSPPSDKRFSTNMFRNERWLSSYRIDNMGKSYPTSFQPEVQADIAANDTDVTGVHSFFFYGPHEHLLPLCTRLDEDFANDVSYCFSLAHILDIAPKGIDKGVAVREVAATAGFDPADAVAFGDGMNDLPMLKAVGRPYVMANSMPALFDALPEAEVVGSNAEDGVAKRLEALLDAREGEV